MGNTSRWWLSLRPLCSTVITPKRPFCPDILRLMKKRAPSVTEGVLVVYCVLLRTKHLECKWINSTSCSKEENHVLNEIMGVISCQIESIKAEFQRILLSSLKLLHSQSCCTPQRSRWRALCEYYMSQIHPPVHAYTFAWHLFQQWNLVPTLTCLLEDEICLWQLFRPDEF